MVQYFATDRPGASCLRAFGNGWIGLYLATCLFWFAATASVHAETASKTRKAPAAAAKEQAGESTAHKPGAAVEKVVASKIGEPTIRRIGPVTTVTEVSSGLPFPARVDTGATTCSIHYEAIEIKDPAESPEDNVGKCVRILFKNSDGKKEWVNTTIVDRVTVRTSTDDDERYKVRLKLRWQDVEKKVLVTLRDREKMKYPMLLGRNFLRGDFLVDVGLGNEK